MDALVICGGEGSRLDAATEKPLVPVGGRPMVDRVLDALTDGAVEDVFAVTSPDAPATRDHVRDRVGTIDGTGDGYATDLARALEAADPPVLTVAADLPLLDGPAIDRVLDRYEQVGQSENPNGSTPSLAVVVPASYKRDLGVSTDGAFEHAGRSVVPAGVNVVAAGPDRFRVVGDDRFAVNVNYPGDLAVAEALA